jgi:GLPGLI family protein
LYESSGRRSIKNQKITAWFAQDLLLKQDLKDFGTPGMILELDINDGAVTVVATKIEFKKVDKELEPPKKRVKKSLTLSTRI